MNGRAGCALLPAVLAAAAALAPAAGAAPPARRSAQADDYHGQRVADPYRWLEDTASGETVAWIEAQDRYARPYLDALPARAHFAARLRALLDYERHGLPQQRGGQIAYTYNRGTDDQDSLWISTDPAARGRLVVDPLALRADGTVALADFELAPDGRHLAYALADGGSDWTTWRVHDVAAARDLPEVLAGTKFTNVAWARNGAGFWYSRYPAGLAPGSWDDDRQVAIWYHALGTPQAADRPVYAIDDHPTRNPYPLATEDGRYLVIRVEDGYRESGLHVLDLGTPGAGVVRLLDRWDARYEFLGNVGPVFYVHTTQGAPNGRIVAIDTRAPDPERWQEVVAPTTTAIAEATLVGGRLIVQYVADVRSRVRVFGLDGTQSRDVPLPGAGTAAGFAGEAQDAVTYFSYTDFTTPRAVYRYEVASGRITPWRVPAGGLDPGAYVTRQVRYRSRDGTEVPMTLVRRRDAPANRPLPTVLYGYGGFNVSLLPAYSASRAAWIEAGGLYAVANLRGGGEFGEAWHEAGTRLARQNVFDDFIAAAEWLLAAGETTRGQLAIQGASNGGLLVGAVLNQRPELFAAAVPGVGVMDMLRYQLASANARQWSSDYGLSEVPEEFRALVRYSPLHNMVAGTCYPPTLVMADANDDRVAPWHSYKYAAALQHAQGCAKNPVLIRIERRAGHGAGAALGKLIDEYADQWAFIAAATGLDLEISAAGARVPRE